MGQAVRAVQEGQAGLVRPVAQAQLVLAKQGRQDQREAQVERVLREPRVLVSPASLVSLV